MSKLDIKLVEKMYSDYGQELTPDRLEYITNQFSNNNDFSNSFLKKYDPEKAVSNTEVEKKNLDSTSTSEGVQSESPTQEPKKKSLLAGGKPAQTGASASSAGKGKKVGGKEIKNESPFGKPAQTFQDQKTQEFLREKEKEKKKIASTKKKEDELPFLKDIDRNKLKLEIDGSIKKDLSGNTISIPKSEEGQKIVGDIQKRNNDIELIKQTGINADIEEKQKQGIAPPTSELMKAGAVNLELSTGDGGVSEFLRAKSFEETISDQTKNPIEKAKESSKSLKINYDNVIKSKDLDLDNPYAYYSKIKDGDSETQELYGSNPMVDTVDFDGFLRKNGYLYDFKEDLKSGFYTKDSAASNSEYNEQLLKEKKLVDYFKLYLEDKSQRDFEKNSILYLKKNPNATIEEIEKNVEKKSIDQNTFDSYIQSNFPAYYKATSERKEKEAKEYKEYKQNKGEFFSWQTGRNILKGMDNTLFKRVNEVSSTIYDLIGFEGISKKLRYKAEEVAFSNPQDRNISYVSGKKVSFGGNEYLVDSEGNIYDYEIKKRVTDLFDKDSYDSLIGKSKKEGKDDSLFSWSGTTIQTTNVAADLGLQILLTRGFTGATSLMGRGLTKEGLSMLSKIPLSKEMAASGAAQTFMGYSEGLESTLVAAKNAGIPDGEAKELANDAAMRMASLYLLTSGISPQTKASFNSVKNKTISEAVEAYAKNGRKGYMAAIDKGMARLMEFTKEGGKETGQEIIQQGATIYGVNKSINEKAGKKIVEEEMTGDQLISMIPSTFVAGGIPIMIRMGSNIFSKKDYLSNLDTASNNVDLSNKRLGELLQSNAITQDEYNKSKEDLRVYSQNKNKIPKDTSEEIVLDVAKKLDEISKLESQKQTLDKSFHADIDEKIEKKRDEVKQLYSNQKTQQTNEEVTGQTDTEKSATGINAEQATSATQQEDANIKLQEEITTKTKEDAVQKQSTNEGLLQPEQSEMGLQEVEQGDQIDQVVAEQGQEKVNTKISDQYTSNEVERVKTLPAESEDGATMNLDGSKYEGGGLVIPLASKNMDASELTQQAIQDFIDENEESVGADNVKVGIYKFPNSNQVSIDVNIVADPSNREEALAIGRELGQESLFDLDTFENVKTGADGMNPKKLTPSEFRAIQERLKPKSKGVEVSKDTNQAKKQVSNITDKKIAKSVLNGVKAISKILPDVKVIIHDTDDSFRSISGESKNQESSGLYQNGEIHINLPKANARTVAHEIFHAILLDKVKTDANAQIVTKKMIESIASKIDSNTDLKAKLEEFASMYDENIQNEEKLAELVGIMAQNYNSLSTRAKEIIKNWLNNLAKSFGVELFESNEVFDVLNTIAKKVATGSEITVENISTLDNGTNPIGGPTEIRIPKKRESKIDFKDSYENSLVTPDKKVDIYSLLEDIVAKKQKVWFWVADQLGVNKDLDGGPSFAHQKEGDIWASSMSTKSIENNINKSDYIFIISGSPTVSKLFNKKVFDKMTSNLGSFDDFKKETLKRKPTKDIVEILNNFKSWDDLRSSTSRKPFLIAINESSKKPNTEFHKYIKSLNDYFDLNDLRDGFYRDNGFEQNDIMLVLKPTSVRSGSDHSTYENTIEGEVIGVPDVKINALEVMPKEMADKYSGKNAQASQAIAPYGSGIKEISTIPSKRQQKALPSKVAEKLTEDGDGNFVFKHYSDQKRDIIKKGQGNNAITSREEASALSAVGGLAMFYTMEGQKETGVGNVEHNILIPTDKVYDIDSDPLGFETEARKRFKEVRPGQAFTNNHRGAFITQVANENGFDVAVTQWRGSELRAQTTKELTPSEKSVDFKERPLDTFKVGDRAIIDGKESIVESVDGQKIGYKSIDGTAQGVTINNERNRRSIIKIEPETSARRQKQNKQELSDAKKEIQDVFSAAKEALKIEKDRNKVINDLRSKVNSFVKVAIQGLNAGDIGKRAITSISFKVQEVTDQNFDEKLKEVNSILDNLYTNRDVNKAKADKKKALKNVMAGKVGKLDKRGDRDKVMASKIVNFALLDPAILKKVLDDANFGLYTSYISNLAERKDALSDTDIKSYERLYDEISLPYKKYTDKVNEIQGKIDSNQDLSEAEKAFIEENKSDFYEKEDIEAEEEKDVEKKAKKEAEIAKKKGIIKGLVPMISEVFSQSDAKKGSFEWKILSTLVYLNESDIEAMPETMLSNTINVLNSMVYDNVIPTYAEDLYRYTVKNKAKVLFSETVARAGKGGLYSTKAGRALLKVREIIGNPITTIRGIQKGNLEAELLEKRIKMFRLSAIDAALKIYGDTPIFDGIMSVLGKGMSNLASTEAKAEEALLNAKRLIDKKSKNPQESYMKITYHLIDAMAKNNQGTKSDVDAIEYFRQTVKSPDSKIRENNNAFKIVSDFLNKVESNNGIVELTPEEATAANAIRIVLDENQMSAYEANLFQNANASPMIAEYFPVSNSLKSQTDDDIKNMQGRFGIGGIVSTKSGNLEEKTGKAHPIDMNPFTAAFSSIKNTAVQFNLRSEYLGISRGLQESINEAVENGDRDSELFLNGIQKALQSEFDLIINGSAYGSNSLMDDVFGAIDRTFYQVMLGSIISRSIDFTGNLVQLSALNPKLLVSGNKITGDIQKGKEKGESESDLLRSFYKNAEASEINKMISAKNSTTERTEFLNKGISKSILSKGLPSSNLFTKLKAKVVTPIDEKLTGINEGLLSISDIKPYGIAWNSIFRDQFFLETGEEVDSIKIARGDREYLKNNIEAIRNASNKANREASDLFGSTNPFEKQVGIMEVTAGKKNNRNPLSALVNRAKYFLSGFTIGANTSMTTAINTFIETKDPREARKALGGAIRVGMYRTAVSAVSGLIWSLFKGDDEDEDKLIESFDKLSKDDNFIKKMNNLFLDFPIQKDRDGNQVELSFKDFKEYNKLRDELLSNKDFKNAYDIYYKYINRNLFDNAVKLRVDEINNSKEKLFKENITVFFDEIKRGFPKTDTEIINAFAIMHSSEGAKLFTTSEVDGYILDLENHMAKIGFLDKRDLRNANSQIDRMIINETALLLSDYRNESASEIAIKEGAQLLMGLMFPRSNNIVKGGYNYVAEGANKMMIQSRRGDRGYDIYKDMIFQPIVKTGLSDKTGTPEAVKEIIGVLNPALKDLLKKDNADAATVSMLRYIKTVGTLGLNDFNKINSKMKNDLIYQNTTGKFKENIIKDIAKDKVDIIREVTDKEGVEKDMKEREAYKSRVLPGIKYTEVKSKLPSYMNKKDLKINGRSVE